MTLVFEPILIIYIHTSNKGHIDNFNVLKVFPSE